MATAAKTPLAKLREPFPEHQISKLPKESRKQIDERKNDRSKVVWNCPQCGGIHHKDAVHLDYVGHAAATDRLLDADPEWTWEPLAVDQRGLPAFDENGGLWIRLTVGGVTRIGYGSADGKSGGDAKKEIIGDAIRNAGMRFGMALDLWHKGNLHLADNDDDASHGDSDLIDDAQWALLITLIEQSNTSTQAFCEHYGCDSVKHLPRSKFDDARDALQRKLRRPKPEAAARKAANPQACEVLADEIPY